MQTSSSLPFWVSPVREPPTIGSCLDEKPGYIDYGAAQQQKPECDFYCSSVKPCDTPTLPLRRAPHDYVVTRDARAETPEACRASSPSPLPSWRRLSISPAPHVLDGSSALHAQSFTTRKRSCVLLTPVLPTPKKQRYEDWRDRKHAYVPPEDQETTMAVAQPLARTTSKFALTPQPQPSCNDRPRPNSWYEELVAFRVNEAAMKGPYHGPLPQSDHQRTGLPLSGYRAVFMERSLSCDAVVEPFMTDMEAAEQVRRLLTNAQQRRAVARHERILLGLVHPKTAGVEFELDNDALESIFWSANAIFFSGRLTGRVQWDWSDETSNPQYDSKIIGHTSLRHAPGGGIETFVLLSKPILRHRGYSRRLLISAFLHELIHCYLFICCGFEARAGGGHTDGFHSIADAMDCWVGRENLFLCQVEADLERFRRSPAVPDSAGNDQDHGRDHDHDAVPTSSSSFFPPYYYMLSSPDLNSRCDPTTANAAWERRINDRWVQHQINDPHAAWP